MKVNIIGPVTYGKSIIEDGIIELDEGSAKALIAEGRAEAVLEEVEEKGQEGAAEGDAKVPPEEDPGVIIEKQKSALDAKFNRDALATAAKEVGVEFAYNAKKADIVEAVIIAGKADLLITK